MIEGFLYGRSFVGAVLDLKGLSTFKHYWRTVFFEPDIFKFVSVFELNILIFIP
jgi:hypothetical protein